MAAHGPRRASPHLCESQGSQGCDLLCGLGVEIRDARPSTRRQGCTPPGTGRTRWRESRCGLEGDQFLVGDRHKHVSFVVWSGCVTGDSSGSAWLCRLGAHAITIAFSGIGSAMGNHSRMLCGHGQVMARGRFQDFVAQVVEGCQVLEYDTLPQHPVGNTKLPGIRRSVLVMPRPSGVVLISSPMPKHERRA